MTSAQLFTSLRRSLALLERDDAESGALSRGAAQ
jgi:hypothetical protein